VGYSTRSHGAESVDDVAPLLDHPIGAVSKAPSGTTTTVR
jgi:hypothetical protein